MLEYITENYAVEWRRRFDIRHRCRDVQSLADQGIHHSMSRLIPLAENARATEGSHKGAVTATEVQKMDQRRARQSFDQQRTKAQLMRHPSRRLRLEGRAFRDNDFFVE